MSSSFARPIRILMLDRDDAAVRLARDSFELAGLPATVDPFRSPREALAAANEYDVVLADLALAGRDGDDFVAKLRDAATARRIPLIGLSDGAGGGADHVFTRPRDEAEFMGVVAAIKFFWMNEAPSLPPPPAADGPSQRPRRLSSVDLMALPIEPAEAYLLSVLDGEMGVDEISSVLGAPVDRTRKMLRRLAELGAVRWHAPHPSLPAPPPPVAASSLPPSPQPAAAFAKTMPAPSLPIPALEPPSPPAATLPLEAPEAPEAPPETSDAPPERFTEERKRRIDDAYALIDEADHYEMLGVARDASRKDVREAYFALAKLFHTDTLYGVDLGDYGRKMDRVFQALTEAYDVLGKKKSRQAYDEYLGAVKETQALDAAPPAEVAPDPAAPAREDAAAVRSPGATKEPDDGAAKGAKTNAAPAPSATSSSGRTARMTKSETMRAVARQRARDLRVHGRRDASPPPGPKTDAIASLSRALKEVSRTSGRFDRASRLIADAREAERKGNVAGAAEALRIAVAWRPDDAALKADAERLHAVAVREKAGAYEKRARFAQERMKWGEAADCWAKVADARPSDVDAQTNAALAALRANADLSRAARHAQRAIDLSPSAASAHRLLGQVYAAANKPASAKRALENALALDPKDDEARRQLGELG